MITISTPGKLILAGEWSILEPGNTAIVMAIDRFVDVKIDHADGITFTSPDLGIKKTEFSFNYPSLSINSKIIPQQEKTITCVFNAFEVALKYLQEAEIEIKSFSLISHSPTATHTTDDGKKIKLGIGSSAAATVGIIKAILAFHGCDIDGDNSKNMIFKLSYIAHEKTQNNVGSGCDIAASTWGTTVAYRRFDVNWLHQQQDQVKLTEIVRMPWPHLEIKSVTLPKNFQLCVGFVGYSASTPGLIKQMMQFKSNNPETYKTLITKINDVVRSLIHELNKKDVKNIFELIRKNRMLLKQLSDASNCNLETKELTKLITLAEENNAPAKFSGAGGGDCGIAVCFDEKTAKAVNQAWEKNNFIPIQMKSL